MKPVDVLIHFRQRPDAGSRHVIDSTLRKLPGVIAPWFAPQKEFLVVVYYNPTLVTAKAVLMCVRRLGFDANLVAI
jgi:hypothetical protein